MNCHNCGNVLEENAKFCTNCGATVQTAVEQPVEQPADTQPV